MRNCWNTRLDLTALSDNPFNEEMLHTIGAEQPPFARFAKQALTHSMRQVFTLSCQVTGDQWHPTLSSGLGFQAKHACVCPNACTIFCVPLANGYAGTLHCSTAPTCYQGTSSWTRCLAFELHNCSKLQVGDSGALPSWSFGRLESVPPDMFQQLQQQAAAAAVRIPSDE